MVLVAHPFAGAGVGLAGQAGGEEVHQAQKVSRIESGNVPDPNRMALQGRVRHPRQLSGVGVTFPFRAAKSAGGGEDELNGFTEHADAAAKLEESWGGRIHMGHGD